MTEAETRKGRRGEGENERQSEWERISWARDSLIDCPNRAVKGNNVLSQNTHTYRHTYGHTYTALPHVCVCDKIFNFFFSLPKRCPNCHRSSVEAAAIHIYVYIVCFGAFTLYALLSLLCCASTPAEAMGSAVSVLPATSRGSRGLRNWMNIIKSEKGERRNGEGRNGEMASGGGYVNFFFLFWSWPVRGNLHTLQRKLMAKHMCGVGQKKGALCGAKLSLSAVYRAVVFRLNQLISAKCRKGGKDQECGAESHNKIHSYSYTYSYKCNTDTATYTIQTSPKNNSQSAQRSAWKMQANC